MYDFSEVQCLSAIVFFQYQLFTLFQVVTDISGGYDPVNFNVNEGSVNFLGSFQITDPILLVKYSWRHLLQSWCPN